ncbi:MAG TPA: tail fiber domain-containing protein [Pyrinomonadaceae bacterium]|jgi:hypothetical protein|nr:tail fiber domain-containing protein [Pyrinomonadaceae bacterium]
MRQRLLFNYSCSALVIAFVILASVSTAFAQTTSFTYQGRLTDGGTAANGNYDLQFALWNSLSGGAQVGATQTLNTVAVSNGVFTVSLDFGASAFTGASRFLEIGARPAGSGSFTPLTPRQEITSTPYAVRSLNAASADSVPASGVPAGSGNYIQNTTSPQSVSNFNITGTGTANVVNATTQYNLNGSRILSNPGSNNLFAGAGAASTSGSQNSFFGSSAGAQNTTSSFNSFFGSSAGQLNTTGSENAFFGARAGASNTTGRLNAFFGMDAGVVNTTGEFNAFFGQSAGSHNTTGSGNSFFGGDAGSAVESGSNNTFIGINASGSGTSVENTLVGTNTSVSAGVSRGTAIGANARVDQSNSLVLGSNANVGIGTTTPTARLSVVATGDGARVLQLGTERAWVFKQFGTGAASALELTGDDANNNNKNFVINTQGNVGIGTQGPLDRLHVFGDIRVGVTGTNGCLKNNNGGTIVGTCSSDLRFKRDLVPFGQVLNKLTRLQPKYYFWRAAEFPQKQFGAAREAGLVAQEVEQVLPELVSADEQGYKQVDYSKLPLMLLQAVKDLKAENDQLKQQQQELLENQQEQIKKQQQQIAGLKKLVCRSHRRAAVCR